MYLFGIIIAKICIREGVSVRDFSDIFRTIQDLFNMKFNKDWQLQSFVTNQHCVQHNVLKLGYSIF